MSTRDVLCSLVIAKRVMHVPPHIRGVSATRHVFLEARLGQRMEGAMYGRTDYDKRFAMLAQDLDNFTFGQFISFGDHPFEKDKNAFMARTDPVESGIFDIRSQHPSPALRIFGAFTETDTFIGLTARKRSELGGRNEPYFSNAIANALLVWNSLFPDHAPFYNANPAEHVSQNVYIV